MMVDVGGLASGQNLGKTGDLMPIALLTRTYLNLPRSTALLKTDLRFVIKTANDVPGRSLREKMHLSSNSGVVKVQKFRIIFKGEYKKICQNSYCFGCRLGEQTSKRSDRSRKSNWMTFRAI